MAEELKFEGRLWAIVGTGQKQYIGKVEKVEAHTPSEGESDLNDVCPPCIELCPCYEFLSLTRMLQLPDGSQVPAREVLVLPVDKCKRDVRKRFRPTDITWAEDIHELDRQDYVNLIRDLRQQAEEARGQEVGMHPAPTNFDPKNFDPSKFKIGGPPFGRP